MVGFGDLGGLFQPRRFHDSVTKPQQWLFLLFVPLWQPVLHINGVSGRAGKSWQPPRFSGLLCFAGHDHIVSASAPCKKQSPAGGGTKKRVLPGEKHSSLPEPAEGCKAKKGEYKGGTRRGLEQPRFVQRLKATQQTWTWISLLFLFPPSLRGGGWRWGFGTRPGPRPGLRRGHARGTGARPARACRAWKCPAPSSCPSPAVLLNPWRPSRY